MNSSSLNTSNAAKLSRIVELCGERLKVAGDILTYADFFFMADTAVPYAQPLSEEEARDLCGWRDEITLVQWTGPAIEAQTRDYTNRNEIDFKKLIKLVRFAISGKAIGPGLWESLTELGSRSVSVRVDCCIGCWWMHDSEVVGVLMQIGGSQVMRERLSGWFVAHKTGRLTLQG